MIHADVGGPETEPSRPLCSLSNPFKLEVERTGENSKRKEREHVGKNMEGNTGGWKRVKANGNSRGVPIQLI